MKLAVKMRKVAVKKVLLYYQRVKTLIKRMKKEKMTNLLFSLAMKKAVVAPLLALM